MKIYMPLTCAAAGLLLAAVTAPAARAATPEERPAQNDKKFLMAAAEGSTAEIRASQLALSHTSNPQVLNIAHVMIVDHNALNAAATHTASTTDVMLGTSLNHTHQRMLSDLGKKHGAAFDQAFLKDMAKDHSEDIAAFQREISNGSSPAIVDFARSGLPVIQHHFDMIQGEAHTESVDTGIPYTPPAPTTTGMPVGGASASATITPIPANGTASTGTDSGAGNGTSTGAGASSGTDASGNSSSSAPGASNGSGASNTSGSQ